MLSDIQGFQNGKRDARLRLGSVSAPLVSVMGRKPYTSLDRQQSRSKLICVLALGAVGAGLASGYESDSSSSSSGGGCYVLSNRSVVCR